MELNNIEIETTDKILAKIIDELFYDIDESRKNDAAPGVDYRQGVLQAINVILKYKKRHKKILNN